MIEETEAKKTKKQNGGRDWTDSALEVGEQVLLIAGTSLLSGFCMALGGAAFSSIRDSMKKSGEVVQLKKVG